MANTDRNFDPGMMLIDDPAAAGPAVPPKVSAPLNRDGSLAVLLHPLVIINVSEHYTRIRAQNNGAGIQVFGAILGVQDGRRVEVFNSFELIVESAEMVDTIDRQYLDMKSLQFKEVFPNLDVLGWYTTGSQGATDSHLQVHKQMMEVNESPLFLLLDPTPKANARELPITFFESVIELSGDQQTTSFVNAGYSLATEEAERIGVDHVAKVSGASGPTTSSEVTLHLSTHRSAMEMMRERIVIIRNYLQAVEAGKLPRNHQILREIAGLCSRLPIGGDGAAGGSKFLKNTNDALLISYMAMMTKGFNAMSDMLEKFPIVHDRGASRRGRTWF